MQDTTPTRSPLAKRLLIIGGVVLVLAAVILGTVFVLKNVIPKKTETPVAESASAKDVVALYRVPGVIKGLSDSLYNQQPDEGMNVPVTYKSDSRDYAVSTQTPINVLFYSKTTTAQDDVQAVQDQTTVFMQSKGYEKIDNQVPSDDGGPDRIRYSSSNAVCQLISSGNKTLKGSPSSHQFACVENSAIDSEYAAVETLLALRGESERPAFTEAVRQSASEGNKAYAILQLTSAKKPPTLLFAAVNDSWSYLGDLNASEGESTGKYVISADIEAKINDSKYGDFLTNSIQGRTSS